MNKKNFLILKPTKCKYSYTNHHRPLKNPDREEKKTTTTATYNPIFQKNKPPKNLTVKPQI